MNQPVLQPMTESDLKRIEEALGHQLPLVFRNVMFNFPQELIDAAMLIDSDGNACLDDMVISPSVEAILAGMAHYQSSVPGWPAHYIVVGENGCGEVYSVDISQQECPVFVSGPHNDAGANFPHEQGYFEQVSDTLDGWVKGLVQRAKDTAAGINPIEQVHRLLEKLKDKNS